MLNICCIALMQIACSSNSAQSAKDSERTSKPHESVSSSAATHDHKIDQRYTIEKIAQFDEPWALASLADGHLLITEKSGKLKLFDPKSKQMSLVQGLPIVAYGGQGGLGDVVLHPDYAKNKWIYLSYAEKGENGNGAAVIRGELDLTQRNSPQLKNIKRIWEQVPKVSGEGHYAHRIVFDQQNKLWISSGERQHFDPAQDMNSNLGKIVHLNDDGTASNDNPFFDQGGVAAQIWSLGHRNPLGLAFDASQKLWVVEMGPKGGDELNLVLKGQNYGYPLVSNGDHYDGKPMPDHATRPEFKSPELDWTPVISPSSMIIYQSDVFPAWKNKALIGGLSSQAIIVVDLSQKPVREVQRLQMGIRIRDVLQASDGTIWVIEDEKGAHLLKLKPE